MGHDGKRPSPGLKVVVHTTRGEGSVSFVMELKRYLICLIFSVYSVDKIHVGCMTFSHQSLNASIL